MTSSQLKRRKQKSIIKATFEALETRQLMAANSSFAFLQQPSTFAMLTGALPHAFVDLNLDGAVDLVRSSGIGPNAATVQFGNGIGGFGAANFYPSGGNTVDIEAAEGNADALKDVFLANAGSTPTIDVLRSPGNGTLVPMTSIQTGNYTPVDIAVADINRDGKPDLIVAEYFTVNIGQGQIVTMLGNGQAGSFQAPVVYAPSPTTQFTGLASVSTGDFNNDGWVDIIATHSSVPGYQIWLNDQTGAFTRQPIIADSSNFPGRVEVADFNKDGLPDFAFTCTTSPIFGSSVPSHDITVGINNGSGGFSTSHYELDSDADYIIRQHATIAVADFDVDGNLDLAISGEKSSGPPNQQVAIFRGNGSGGFTRARKFSTDFGAYRLSAVDVTGDGNPDLLSTQSASSTFIRHFSSLTTTSFAQPSAFKFWNNQPATTSAFVQTIDNNTSISPTYTWFAAGAPATPIPTPVNVGSYVVKATWAGNANYGPSEATQSYNILPAAPTINYSVAPSTVYNGSPVIATATVTGIFGEQLGQPNIRYFLASDTTFSNQLPGAPSDAGSYKVYYNFLPSGNYSGANELVFFEITPATPSVSLSITNAGNPANGQPISATGNVTGINGANLGSPTISYYLASDTAFANPLPGAPSAAGQYVAVGRFEASGNYLAAQASQAFAILAAESLVVTTTADELDANASPDLGGTSLREALRFAELKPGSDTITFAPGLAGQTISLVQGWINASDDSTLRISGDVTLQGPSGGVTLAVAPGVAKRHLFVQAGATFSASNLRFTGGSADNVGGAIWNLGSLSLENVTFSSNHANGLGGAIYNDATTHLINSMFASNSAGEGGAIQSVGTLTISTSTFSGNSSNFNGGALRLYGTTTIDSSTFNNNTVVNEGGALINFGNIVISNSTVANNGKNAILLWDGTADVSHVTAAYNDNGGLLSVFAATTLRNSIVAGNAGFDQSGTLTAASSSNLLNLSASAARLGTLVDNGGTTKTIALLAGSPAINAAATLPEFATDQRGVARPQGFAPDIGAYERQATSASLINQSYEYESRQAITINFDNDASVIFGRNDITLTNISTNQVIASGSFGFNSAGDQATLLLTNQLQDGDYRAVIGATQVDFTSFAGDANNDRSVNLSDFTTLAANFGQAGRVFSQGNFDYSNDGAVTLTDFTILASQFGKTLPAARSSSLVQSTRLDQVQTGATGLEQTRGHRFSRVSIADSLLNDLPI